MSTSWYNIFFTSRCMLKQCEPLSFGLHLVWRWVWHWAAFWHAPAPLLGSCSTVMGSWCSTTSKNKKEGDRIVGNTVFSQLLSLQLRNFILKKSSHGLEQLILECVKSQSSGLLLKYSNFSPVIQSEKHIILNYRTGQWHKSQQTAASTRKMRIRKKKHHIQKDLFQVLIK